MKIRTVVHVFIHILAVSFLAVTGVGVAYTHEFPTVLELILTLFALVYIMRYWAVLANS